MSDRRVHETVSRDEYEQFRRDFAVLREQFEAADGVLAALGRSAADPETVLGTVVETPLKPCRSDVAHLYVLEGRHFALIKCVGVSDESLRFIAEHPHVGRPGDSDRSRR